MESAEEKKKAGEGKERVLLLHFVYFELEWNWSGNNYNGSDNLTKRVSHIIKRVWPYNIGLTVRICSRKIRIKIRSV